MLKSYMPAPSKIDRFAQLDVAGALFRGQKLALLDHFKLYAATGEAPPPAEPPLVDISVDHIPLYYEKVRILHEGLQIREAAGVPLLGYCMTTLCEILSKLKKDEKFIVYSEYPVVKTPKQGKIHHVIQLSSRSWPQAKRKRGQYSSVSTNQSSIRTVLVSLKMISWKRLCKAITACVPERWSQFSTA